MPPPTSLFCSVWVAQRWQLQKSEQLGHRTDLSEGARQAELQTLAAAILMPDACCSSPETHSSTHITRTGPIPSFSGEGWARFTPAQRKAPRLLFKAGALFTEGQHSFLAEGKILNTLECHWDLTQFNRHGSTHQGRNRLCYFGVWAITIIFMVFFKDPQCYGQD